jgi:hypothetical protein
MAGTTISDLLLGLGTGKPISSLLAVGQGQYTVFNGLSISASLFHREICGAGDPDDFHKKCLGYIMAVTNPPVRFSLLP